MKYILLVIAFFNFTKVIAQDNKREDTVYTHTLQEVVVRAYEQNRQIREVASPLSILNQQELRRFGSVSMVAGLNSTPGVRMEERSPGSYRLNIRGSSLRSPFGVRNVKIYWNDIPFTDPGGNTYLNQFSLFNFSSIEVLKGPGSSLYGAGTGGVMLLNSFPDNTENQLSLNYSGGSFQSQNLNVSAVVGNPSFRNVIAYTHQRSDGYRLQSSMRRDIVSWESRIVANEKQSLSTHVLYGDLYYETPGALTKAQYLADPKAARPAAAGFPSAIENEAAIYQKTFWAGIHHQYNFNDHWQNSTSIYGAFSQIRNPAIRNYERRLEPHFGGRTSFSFLKSIKETNVKVVAGAEMQQGYSNIKVYRNNKGRPDSMQTDDEVNNRLAGVFFQGEVSFKSGWIATAGISFNTSVATFERLSVVPPFKYKTDFNNEIAPRISLLKKLNSHVSVYGVFSKGFSPPTVAELLPSTSVINTDLQAEKGFNYELGSRGGFFNNRLLIDINLFHFQLQRSITQRRDASGADYFINAGDTKQQGIETGLNYFIAKDSERFLRQLTVWCSYTYHRFRYKNFKQLNNDFSGNQIPSIAPHTVAAGIEIVTKPGWYANINYYYSDRIALNDLNSDFASSYNLAGFKSGFKKSFGSHISADLFFSGDNLFNQKYSLGNDINAAGSRFYNAAPGINYQVGISLQYK